MISHKETIVAEVFSMGGKSKPAILISAILMLLLAACGKSSTIHALTDEQAYVEYAGYQFSGAEGNGPSKCEGGF